MNAISKLSAKWNELVGSFQALNVLSLELQEKFKFVKKLELRNEIMETFVTKFSVRFLRNVL